jgi:ribosome-binding ATPase YchF (GTP1/OBG family)
MKVGLIGFPGSGKTSVFHALTAQQSEIGHSGKGHGQTHFAVVKGSDPKLSALLDYYRAQKPGRTSVVFVDAAAPPGVAGRGFDASALAAMREVDALAQVVRGFRAADGMAADPLGELTDLATEMRVSDLAVLDRRLSRLQKESPQPGEKELLLRLRDQLERKLPLRDLPLSVAEHSLVAGCRFLSAKPLLVLLNLEGKDLDQPIPSDVESYLKSHKLTALPIRGIA